MARKSGAIAPKTRTTPAIEKLVAELAPRQHFVVSRRQLLFAGASVDAIRHQLRARRWCRLHAGVYAVVPSRRLGSDGHFMAAVLCGDNAVLSHGAAAALWDLRLTPAGPIDVTTPCRGTRHRRGITVHTSRNLNAEDVTTCRQIPCTTVARTLLDLAGCVNRRALDRAIERAQVLKLYDHRALEAVLARANGRRGAGRLRRSLDGLADDPAPTRSELERRFLDLVHDAGLPAPVVNRLVGAYEVDFHWPPQRLVVETDGRLVHGTPQAFERDRRRDLDLELAGWHVLRVGWRQITDHPDRVVALVRSRLSRVPS